MITPVDVEVACEIMHDAYEKAAVGAGWETNPKSRKPWNEVPESNKQTMRAAVSALLIHREYIEELRWKREWDKYQLRQLVAIVIAVVVFGTIIIIRMIGGF